MTNREAAIEWFSMLKKKFVKTEYEGYLDLAISVLEKQEEDRWIPVTDRLPEEDGRYLITEKTDGTKVQEGYFCRTRDGEPYWGYLHVTAWRPLPEPYTEEKA